MTDAWGLGQLGFSNGAAYVDLNNSGALDLVINRINEPAAIYRNVARDANGRHYLRVALRGSGGNTAGIGARVTIWQGATTQLLEQMPTRGFQSSVDPRLHFGLGASSRIDSLLVVWPDKRFQLLTNVAADQTLTLEQRDAADCSRFVRRRPHNRRSSTSRRALASIGGTARTRRSTSIVSRYSRTSLSADGPAIAVGDVNGDGLDDMYVGGAKWQAGALFLQQRDGTFRESPQPAFRADSLFEDVDAVFFDANGDGHPDLYVVSGGNGVLRLGRCAPGPPLHQ